MFCPRCSQEQISEQTRFCSRCGFPLTVVSEILANGGSLPQLAALSEQKKFLTRKTGFKISLIWFLTGTFLLTPILAISNADPLVPVVAILGFMGGLLMMLFSWLFLENETKYAAGPVSYPDQTTQANLYGRSADRNVLPPQQAEPTSTFVPPMNSWKAPDTGELVEPGSVTENTTKLLNKEE